MSIILDALKKAEAERQRGHVPTLHTAGWAGKPKRGNSRIVLIASIGLVLCASAAWWTFRGKTRENPENTALAGQQSDAQASPIGASDGVAQPQSNGPQRQLGNQNPMDAGGQQEATDAATQGTSSAQAAQFGPAPQLQTPLTGAATLSNVPESLAAIAAPPQPVNIEPLPVPNQELTPPQGVAEQPIAQVVAPVPAPEQLAQLAQSMTASPAAVPELYQLDYQTRSALPKLSLTLHVYHAAPQRRFVIVNNKRYGEGEQVDGKVMLLQIVRDGVECEFNGVRFLLPRQI